MPFLKSKAEQTRAFFGGAGGTAPVVFSWVVQLSELPTKAPPNLLDFCWFMLTQMAIFILLGALGALVGIASNEQSRWKLLMLGVSLPALFHGGFLEATQQARNTQEHENNGVSASGPQGLLDLIFTPAAAQQMASAVASSTEGLKNFEISIGKDLRAVSLLFFDANGGLIESAIVDSNVPARNLLLPKAAIRARITSDYAKDAIVDLSDVDGDANSALIRVAYKSTPFNGFLRALGDVSAQPGELIAEVQGIISTERYYELLPPAMAYGTRQELLRAQTSAVATSQLAEQAASKNIPFDPFAETAAQVRTLEDRIAGLSSQLAAALLDKESANEALKLCQGNSCSPAEFCKISSIVDATATGLPSKVVFFFDLNRAGFRPDIERDLAELSQCISSKKANVSQVTILGHTDKIGSELRNITLSRDRAASVAQSLRMTTYFGSLPDDSFELAGKGSSMPISTDATSRIEPRNRRVEVLIAY